MRITFVCLGNICRSPMAEFICKDLVKKINKEKMYNITSCGTSGYHDGEDMHIGTKKMLNLKSIASKGFVSKKINKSLFEQSDIVFVMDDSNYKDVITKFGHDSKIKKITDYSSFKYINHVPDPWYTDNFDETYEILNDCISNFINSIE